MLGMVLLIAFILISLVSAIALIGASLAAGRQDKALHGSSNHLVPQEAPASQSLEWLYWLSATVLASVPCILLTFALVLRAAAGSLPGDSLYPIKLGGEEVKAVLEYAFGTPADWHISQIERRLEEVQALEEAGRAPDPALAEAVKEEAEQALAAAESLPPAERAETLTAWSRQLEAHGTAGENSAVARLWPAAGDRGVGLADGGGGSGVGADGDAAGKASDAGGCGGRHSRRRVASAPPAGDVRGACRPTSLPLRRCGHDAGQAWRGTFAPACTLAGAPRPTRRRVNRAAGAPYRAPTRQPDMASPIMRPLRTPTRSRRPRQRQQDPRLRRSCCHSDADKNAQKTPARDATLAPTTTTAGLAAHGDEYAAAHTHMTPTRRLQ